MRHKVDIALKRAVYIKKIRDFFFKKNFIEVETPIMTPIPGMEPHLTPFETILKTPDNKNYKLFLNTSPELQMKKLLGEGFKNIFQITKVFRNGEIGGPLHNPEFTMLEWYRTKATYKDIMKDCEDLISAIIPKKQIIYQGKKINLAAPWGKISINELFKKHCKIDLLKNKTYKKFQKTAEEKAYDTKGCKTWDDIFFKFFLNHIEPNLGHDPIFIYDYPVTQAALAKKGKNSFFAERFELFIAGMELANAFSELIDATEQRTRLKKEQRFRKKIGKTIFNIDEEFLSRLESINHPCAGIALGIDRLLMILLNKKNIEDILLFPLNKMLWQSQQLSQKD